jgi:hypothetical protein
MMNDRFAAQLRQHLLESAVERPADGQLATVIDRVADTPQRHPVAARLTWLPGRVGPFPSTALRYGLVALALIAATAAAAVLGGGSNGPVRSTVFEGTWTTIDPLDGSAMRLVVGEGTTPFVRFVDEVATGGACDLDPVKLFIADGTGEISGSRLVAEFPDGGGCGLMTVEVVMAYDYVAGSDTLRDQDDVRWTRADRLAEVPVTPPPAQQPPATQAPVTDSPPTQAPPPDPTLNPTPQGPTGSACIDLAQGGTYTAPAGPLSVTATVPDSPTIPWQGERAGFYLSAGCESFSPISILASVGTDEIVTSCMPGSLEITSFADAIAKLDTPKGDDISDRADLTIGGHAAARYDVANLSTCPEGFGLWHMTTLGFGETGSLYVIDVDGVLLAIELNRDGNQTQAELEEAWAIVASLQIAR